MTSLETTQHALQERLSEQRLKRSNVEDMDHFIKEMTLENWNETFHVASFYEVAESREQIFLDLLQKSYELTDHDIERIEVLLFSETGHVKVHKINLECSEFGGRFALFATHVKDGNFSILFADYQLTFSHKPEPRTDELEWLFDALEQNDTEYRNLSFNQRAKFDEFFTYKAMLAFQGEGLLNTIHLT